MVPGYSSLKGSEPYGIVVLVEYQTVDMHMHMKLNALETNYQKH